MRQLQTKTQQGQERPAAQQLHQQTMQQPAPPEPWSMEQREAHLRLRVSQQQQSMPPPPPQEESKRTLLSQARSHAKPPLASSRKHVPVKEKPRVLPMAKKKSLSQMNAKRKPKTVPVDVGQDDAADSGLLFHAATSLVAFESLANETSDDWSKIARATGLMEHEVEAEILDTLANKLVRGSSSAEVNRGEANVGHGTPRRLPSSQSPSSSGSKRGATSLLSTRTSKRLAAAKPAKELPTRKSPFLQRTRSASKHQQASSANDDLIPGVGSPDVNSALFAGGTDTLDAWELQGDETQQRTAFGLERNQRWDCAMDCFPRMPSIVSMSHESHVLLVLTFDLCVCVYSRSNAIISANDLEAISALNSLSNSPALGPLARASVPGEAGRRKTTTKKSETQEDKSFFAKIIGGVKERDAKRKLKY
jgi:hypothetical protein